MNRPIPRQPLALAWLFGTLAATPTACTSAEPYGPCPTQTGTVRIDLFRVATDQPELCSASIEVDVDGQYGSTFACYDGAFEPVGDCTPTPSVFAYGPDADCVFTNTTCESLFDDPLVQDCSASAFADCCSIGSPLSAPPCD